MAQVSKGYETSPSTLMNLKKQKQTAAAVECPVCGGNGQVPQGFYTTTNKQYGALYWSSGETNSEICRSCGGKGYVVLQ